MVKNCSTLTFKKTDHFGIGWCNFYANNQEVGDVSPKHRVGSVNRRKSEFKAERNTNCRHKSDSYDFSAKGRLPYKDRLVPFVPHVPPITGIAGLLQYFLSAVLFFVLFSSVFGQEATMNNYNPRRPPGMYANRVEPHFWNPEPDANNAAVNRSNDDSFQPTQTPLDPPVMENPPQPGDMTLGVPKEVLPGADFLRTPGGLVSTLQIMVILTVITLSPSIMIMTTSFVRVMTVLAVLRQAIGTNQLPPSQVITALSLFITMLIMMPVWSEVYTESVLPFSERRIGLEVAWEKGELPVRQFMAAQIERCGNTDVVLELLRYVKDYKAPERLTWRNVPWRALLPGFMLSELKTSFLIGFQIYLPFLVLDMVIASVMVSMGMMMLPPVIISLPFKLMLFVLMDGWNLVVLMLIDSFEPYTHGMPITATTIQNVLQTTGFG